MHALVCPKCKQNFAQKQKMNNHILICGTDDRLFACNKCEYTCRSTNQLRVHKKQKHPATPGDRSGFFQCDYCAKEYTSMSARRRHMKAVHKPQVNSDIWSGKDSSLNIITNFVA